MNTKSLLTVLLLFASPVLNIGLFAQDSPKAEVFGGYSYFASGSASTSGSVGLDSAHLNGWAAAVKVNLTRQIGLVADFGGEYGDRRIQLPSGSNPSIQVKSGAARQHTFLFGPELHALKTNRFIVNLRALAGATNRNTLVAPLVQPVEPIPPLVGSNGPLITALSASGGTEFAASFGGSIDYKVTERLSYRIIQPELILARFNGSTQLNFRLSTGFVLNLGKL